MTFDFDRIRSFVPPELRELLEKEIAGLGDACPAVDWKNVTVGVALGRVAHVVVEYPVYLPLPPSDAHPLAPWVVAYGAWHAAQRGQGHWQVRRQVEALALFGERALRPLLALAAAPALSLRSQAFPALGKVLAKSPSRLDDAALAVLAAGVADTSAKVRSAAYEALSRHPEEARRALADAARRADGKALNLIKEALARLGAPVDEEDAPSAPSADDVELLAALVERWAATRSPEVADLVDTLASQMPAPPLGGRSKTEKEGEWHVVARRREPASLRALLAAPWPAQWRDARKRLQALQGWADPRIAAALVALLERQPYQSIASITLYREVLRDLSALRDARQLAPLKKAGAALLSRFGGFSYLEDFKRGAQGVSLEAALERVPPFAVPAGDPVVARARARLSGVKAGLERRERAEGDFLARIYEDPGSEELRRVYADWLLEHGDARGEFIALQCERVAGRGGAAADRRERQILSEHEDRLLGPLAPLVGRKGRVFERGFLTHAQVEVPKLARALDERAWATLRALTIQAFGDAERGDAAVLAKLLTGAARRVEALHGLRASVLAPLASLGVELPLEEVDLWMPDARPLPLRLPRLKRLGIIRFRYAFGHDDRARAWSSAVGKEVWAQLTHFAANDTWSELAGWHARVVEMPWLLSVRVLSPETTNVLEPEGWEVRFERNSAGAPVRLVVEAHAGVTQVTPLAQGLARLPFELRRALVVVETRSLGSMNRASLEALRLA